MSNCIWFHQAQGKTNKVVFLKDEIDVAGFKAMVATARDVKTGSTLTDEEVGAYYSWWFLQDNHIADARGVVIFFGEGRSTHTHRDFEGLMKVLQPFLKKPKYHTFCITDEFDGGQKMFFMDVEFKRMTLDGKTQEEREARAKAYVDSLKIDYTKVKVRTLTPNGWVEGDEFSTGLKGGA